MVSRYVSILAHDDTGITKLCKIGTEIEISWGFPYFFRDYIKMRNSLAKLQHFVCHKGIKINILNQEAYRPDYMTTAKGKRS